MKNYKNLIIGAFAVLFSVSAAAQNINADILLGHVKVLASDSLKGRSFGSEQGRIAARYIEEQFKAAGIETFKGSYIHTFEERIGVLNIKGQNVVGIVEGKDPVLKNEYIVIGAHYDHVGWKVDENDTLIYNGADDNASGVAGIIEIGRHLAKNRGALKRSVIIVAFDGEESGLLGSKKILSDGLLDAGDIRMMFSFDMIGMYSKHEGLDLEGINMLDIGPSLVSEAKSKSDVIINKMNSDLVSNTDTHPFGVKGIPAVHVFTGLDSPYHKPEDTFDLLDYEGMATICNFMANLISLASVSEEFGMKEEETKEIAKSAGMKRLIPGIRMNNGKSFFDYPDEFYQARAVYAVGLGFFLETRLSQWLTLQPEVMLEREGAKSVNGNLSLYSVTVPVSILLTSPDPQNNRIRAYFQAGGYFSYTFSGKEGSSDIDFENDVNDQHYGILIGGGFEIMDFRIGYLNKTGITNINRDGNPSNIVLNGSYLTLGWAF